MFIQTETTPNPLTLKFLPGRPVTGGEGVEFKGEADTARSPLASALLELDGVDAVFLGFDFVAVTRNPASGLDWPQLKAPILAALMDHFASGAPAVIASAVAEIDPEQSQIVREIVELLDTRVRPAVAGDGGDIVFDRFEAETGTVYLHMRGACSGCPSSSATLKSGVENMLRHYVPEVKHVEQVL